MTRNTFQDPVRAARIGSLGVAVFLGAATVTEAGAPKLVPSAEGRLRWELFDTPSASADKSRRYDLASARLRLGLDAKWEHVLLHGVVQGAGTWRLPADAAFGIGPVYLDANGGDRGPEALDVAELSATFQTARLRIVAGRQGWGDGIEVPTGVENIEAVKRRRLSERLIGDWDWVNVGRRFDGLSLGAEIGASHVAAFAFAPLAGGVDYKHGFDRLTDTRVYGLTLTGRYGSWIPKTEARLYAIRYDDERPAALNAAGGALRLTTVGASLVSGDEKNDVLGWGAFQFGDWGPARQRAWALIFEGGHRFKVGTAALTARLGVAQASGDDSPGGRHESFFNLLPTNHKFYGTLDYSAFSNLREAYLELLLAPRRRWTARAAVESFSLAERSDAWYGGSGAFNDVRLGYQARRPASGVFAHRGLGTELDVDVRWKAAKQFGVGVGAGYFRGGAAAGEVLAVERNGSWAYVELSWTRP